MPRVSPNKTWSGALGGTLAAGGCCAVVVASQFGIETSSAAAVVASRSVGDFAGGRLLAEFGDQAPFQRQRRKPAHSRPRRPDGPAGWLCGGRECGRLDRYRARRISCRPEASWYGERCKSLIRNFALKPGRAGRPHRHGARGNRLGRNEHRRSAQARQRPISRRSRDRQQECDGSCARSRAI